MEAFWFFGILAGLALFAILGVKLHYYSIANYEHPVFGIGNLVLGSIFIVLLLTATVMSEAFAVMTLNSWVVSAVTALTFLVILVSNIRGTTVGIGSAATLYQTTTSIFALIIVVAIFVLFNSG